MSRQVRCKLIGFGAVFSSMTFNWRCPQVTGIAVTWWFEPMRRKAIAKTLGLIGLALCVSCASSDSRIPEDAQVDPSWPIVEGIPQEAASVGRIFAPLAKRFGNFAYSYASPASGGRALLFEYSLVGEKIGEWSRLVSILFIPVEPVPGAAESLFRQLREAPPLQARVILRESYPGANGGAYFQHYTIGGGPLREEGLSMTWVVTSGAVATFQLMNRGEPYTPEEIGRFRSIAATISGPSSQ